MHMPQTLEGDKERRPEPVCHPMFPLLVNYVRKKRQLGHLQKPDKRVTSGDFDKKKLRTLLQVSLPTEAANKVLTQSDSMSKLKQWLDTLKPEATYFTTSDMGAFLFHAREL